MKNWSSDRWLSMVAIIASLGTLFTIVYQTNLIREQQYASVLPYLEIWNSSNKESYKLVLINNGIGPAFINDVSISFKDSTYHMDPANFLEQVIQKLDTVNNVGHSNIMAGGLIPAGRKVDLLEVKEDSTNAYRLWSWFSGNDTSRIDKPNIIITYSSVYGEKWKISKYGNKQPIPVD